MGISSDLPQSSEKPHIQFGANQFRNVDAYSLLNQTNIGTVSKATLGKLLKGGEERIWALRCVIP